jgi:hypothetical protein
MLSKRMLSMVFPNVLFRTSRDKKAEIIYRNNLGFLYKHYDVMSEAKTRQK